MAARRITALLLFLILNGISPLTAESTRSLINEGNEAYEKEDYVGAEVEYRKALDQDEDLVEGKFNLGGALYKQGKFDGSTRSLDETLDSVTDDEMAAKTWFNRGNALFKQQMYEESIDSYIHSLKLDPDDMDAKSNLLYARKMLKKQQQQQSQQQPSDGQQNKDQEDQENREQQEKQSEGQDQEESETDDRSASPEEERQDEEMSGESKPEDERQISRSEAERILQALKENEKEVQKKLRAKPAGRARVERDW
jgi:tetratricopeptide (TPR) repeat protein